MGEVVAKALQESVTHSTHTHGHMYAHKHTELIYKLVCRWKAEQWCYWRMGMVGMGSWEVSAKRQEDKWGRDGNVLKLLGHTHNSVHILESTELCSS